MRSIPSLLLAIITTCAVAQNKFGQMEQAVRVGRYPNVHSILVSQNGQTVYEQYFNRFKSDSLHDTRSAFKSIASLLAGIAIDKGMIKGVDQKVASFFPEDTAFGSHPLKNK